MVCLKDKTSSRILNLWREKNARSSLKGATAKHELILFSNSTFCGNPQTFSQNLNYNPIAMEQETAILFLLASLDSKLYNYDDCAISKNNIMNSWEKNEENLKF
jgi:hypothetical protein